MNCSERGSDETVAQERYSFDLPAALIAQEPTDRRGDSRLLLVEAGAGVRAERCFRDLPELLAPGDLLVVNDSRVLPARLWTRRATGGRVELLLIRPVDAAVHAAVSGDTVSGDTPEDARAETGQVSSTAWLAMARPARRLVAGEELLVTDARGEGVGDGAVTVVSPACDGYITVGAADGSEDVAALAERWGEMPLPPYIRRPVSDPRRAQRCQVDQERYQTVYARADEGGAASVAAPTAGLHFSATTLERLSARGIAVARLRLHVGPGTFRPPTAAQFQSRRLHRERFICPAETSTALQRTRRAGGRVVAVGTTSLRVLETVLRLNLAERGEDEIVFAAAAEDPEPVFTGSARRRPAGWEVAGETRLFLRPPDRVRSVDGLLTNFHLPGSSLLMLVAVVAGEQTWRGVYEHAVAAELRFYSYGDAMLILPPASGITASGAAATGAIRDDGPGS